MCELGKLYLGFNWAVRILIGSLCLTIGLIMFTSKRFKQHPYRIYGIELILLASYTLNIYRFIIDFELFDGLRSWMVKAVKMVRWYQLEED